MDNRRPGRIRPPGPVNPWVVLAIASTAAFMVMLDTQVLFVAFDDIRSSFPEASLAAMSWTLSGYTIALAATLITAGRMTDRFGRRRTFSTGLVIFTLASLLCGVAPGPELLVAFRVVQALGAAALMPSAIALVLAAFPPDRVPFAVASWGASGAFAAGVGPTVGALLVDSFGWRSVFLANVPVGVVALVLALRLLPESRETVRTRFPDPWGTLLLAGALTLLALGIVQSEEWGALTARTFGAVLGGLATLVWFVRRSLAVPHPALDLGLFARPSFRWANITTAVFTIGFTALFFALIQFMTSVWHYDVVSTGLAMMPAPFVVMLLGPQMGRAAARYGQRKLLVPGGLVYAAAGAFLLVSLDTEPSWATHLLPASLLTGLGASLVLPQLTSAAVRELAPDEFGAGAAVNQAVRQFGATFGIALTVALLAGASPLDSVEHFRRVWAMVLGCGVLASLTALALPHGARRAPGAPEPVVAGSTV